MANIMVIIDGMTDFPSEALGGKTPFEYANPLSIKHIKENYAHGELQTTPIGLEADSMNCILTLLGTQPSEIPKGRAFLEALAMGINCDEKDFIMRCNLVGFDKNGVLKSSCAEGLSSVEMKEISNQLTKLTDDKIGFYHMSKYKNILILKDFIKPNDSIKSFPPHQNTGKNISELTPNNILITEFYDRAEKILDNYKTDTYDYKLLVWGGCYKKKLPSFKETNKMSGASVSKTEIVRGISCALGMYTPPIPTATADVDTDLNTKLNMALSLANDYEFILIHLNGSDEASHRKNPIEKSAFIKRIDSELIAPLLQTNHKLLICTDHTTSSITGEHMGGYQPFYLYGVGKGDLGKFIGTDAIELFRGQN